jgi:hypothetical protein
MGHWVMRFSLAQCPLGIALQTQLAAPLILNSFKKPNSN